MESEIGVTLIAIKEELTQSSALISSRKLLGKKTRDGHTRSSFRSARSGGPSDCPIPSRVLRKLRNAKNHNLLDEMDVDNDLSSLATALGGSVRAAWLRCWEGMVGCAAARALQSGLRQSSSCQTSTYDINKRVYRAEALVHLGELSSARHWKEQNWPQVPNRRWTF